MRTGQDERIWRPLINPRNLQISAFSDAGPRGFGLMQRARKFTDYQDLEAQYQKRPSLWIEPIGDWGKGVVELVEIPIRQGGQRQHRRILAPAGSVEGQKRIQACLSDALVLVGAGARPIRAGDPDPQRQVVERRQPAVRDRFRRRRAATRGKPETPPALDVGADKGKIVNAVAERNPDLGGWRVSIELDTQKQPVVECTPG